MSYMLEEIREQPEAIRRLLTRQTENVNRLAAAWRDRGIDLVFIAGRGTSDHAGVYAKYLFEIAAGVPVALAAPSVFTLYGGAPRLERALVLAISQSGAAADACEVLNVSRKAGYLTACITNNTDSPMAAAAEFVLDCGAGREQSLPATKTYTTSLAAVAALVAAVAPSSNLSPSLAQVPDLMQKILRVEDSVAAQVERYRYMEECIVLARGINQCTALETALKMTETSYVRAHPYSAADFMHGPIAAVEEGTACFLYAPSGRGLETMREATASLAERGAELIVVSDDESVRAHGTTQLQIPESPELMSPLVSIVAGQLFAYHLALVKGRDPDKPRGLRKVTVTH